jgi:general nucleoside transport system ATP-binding protein
VAQNLAVELVGITKRFPGVIANQDVNLAVEQGEIHAICGENGAGKSTLMKILYGMQPADEGRMLVNGEEVKFRSPKEAIAAGVGMVHQHFMLADNLTVLENVILGSEPKRPGGIDFNAARRHLEEVGESYGLTIEAGDLVESLEVGERQRVEIIKVLFRGARILILDEPTAVLVPQEVEELFRNMRELKAEGHTILFIDHKLDEVLEIADTITVLRRGKTVATVKPSEVTTHDLAELMVGAELPSPATREATVTDVEVLAVDGLAVNAPDGSPRLRDVSFKIHRGEIVGVAGVEGNGQAELVEALLGIAPVVEGRIHLEGTDISDWSVRRRREAGMGYIPEDRHRRGILLDSPLWENTMLGQQSVAPFVRGIWINKEAARERADLVIKDYDVRTPSIDVPARALSGGNQQKMIVGREMSAALHLLIAAHPTRGIDVGAQAAVWEQLKKARAAGLAVLLVSADLDELIGLSDRLVVMLRGVITAELDPNTVTPRLLGGHMTGAVAREGEA